MPNPRPSRLGPGAGPGPRGHGAPSASARAGVWAELEQEGKQGEESTSGSLATQARPASGASRTASASRSTRATASRGRPLRLVVIRHTTATPRASWRGSPVIGGDRRRDWPGAGDLGAVLDQVLGDGCPEARGGAAMAGTSSRASVRSERATWLSCGSAGRQQAKIRAQHVVAQRRSGLHRLDCLLHPGPARPRFSGTRTRAPFLLLGHSCSSKVKRLAAGDVTASQARGSSGIPVLGQGIEGGPASSRSPCPSGDGQVAHGPGQCRQHRVLRLQHLGQSAGGVQTQGAEALGR